MQSWFVHALAQRISRTPSLMALNSTIIHYSKNWNDFWN